MSKKKRPNQASAPQRPVQLPVLHGNVFSTFISEAQSLGNEVNARREFDADVGEYLTQKGLLDEWSKWREAKRAPNAPNAPKG